MKSQENDSRTFPDAPGQRVWPEPDDGLSVREFRNPPVGREFPDERICGPFARAAGPLLTAVRGAR